MVAPYTPIADIVPWTQAIAGLNQFIYSTNWTANDSSDILVYSRLPGIPTNDLLQLVDPSNYTVQFIGASNVVQVTFNSLDNPPQYNIVTIMRDTPSEFLNLYTNTNFTPSMLNGDFETLVQIDQQNQLYWQQIVPRYNNSATVNVPIDTILPILGAGQFWIKNSTNTAFIPATLGSGGTFPVLGPFVLYSADSNYPEGFDLATLPDGLLAQTTLLGVATPYTIPFPLPVDNGGTGLDSITPFAVLTGGTTSTSPIVPISDLGDIGDVLTSAGPGFPPSFQPSTPPLPTGFTSINVQTFSSSGIYTPTAGMVYCTIECMGAGGGGGGTITSTSSGVFAAAGGGAGGYSRKTVAAAVIGASQTVTIGSGGTGGVAGNNVGVTGGTTQVGSISIATGGTGGGGNNQTAPAGGIGGHGTAGDILAYGANGQGGTASIINTILVRAGAGASSQWGQGGSDVFGTTGSNAAGYGAGGAGGGSVSNNGAQSGGAGSKGFVIITEYITT
jgi:hypothetical protein